ncbi:MAG TPA: bifunctional diaminohydroxyphosphoribosylaminopyrimidine deaminase/5-amino-6-(5-phosphoribosylamino)uracil reductase RibD, partial [Chitinophagales bacterium]|nr:bifunctional diaminohydroxyphosphoribosylaminopyrimidine deaminase/5-amino-6-(5-phosphoribosylamino)uracil reductase RibD [Chitinophagales bacterium]
ALLPQSTLYVNLEPCAHYGKTPPCSTLIVNTKIPRVVIGSADPNPQVAGKGIKMMREAGIEVTTGVLRKECDFLNRRFLTFFTQQRPYVILKWAQSADGFMAPANGAQFWFTNEQSRKLVHVWRSQEQAILAGRRTIEIDDPELNVRLTEGKNPTRIIIDRQLSLPLSLRVFRPGADVIIYNNVTNLADKNLRFVKLNFSQNILPQLLRHLYDSNIQSVMVEGGATTFEYFTEQNLWDEARAFYTDHLLQDGMKAPLVKGTPLHKEKIENDLLNIVINPDMPYPPAA